VNGRLRAEHRLLVAGAVVLVATSVAALPDRIFGAEEWLFRLLNDLPDWLERPTWPLMQLGALAVVPVVAVIAWLIRREWRLPTALLAAGGTAWVLAKVVKEIVQRGRPQLYLPEDSINLRPEWDGLGFVSGHAAVVFALVTVVSPHLSRSWRIVAWTAAVATALLRMYTAAHLPLDIIGGAGLGIALGALARWAFTRREAVG